MNRLKFASYYASRHLLLSCLVAVLSATFVFFILYPFPYNYLLGVSFIFFILLAVDVICGPLLTLILAAPQKSRKERFFDFFIIGLIQLAALLYGLNALWLARPTVLAFEHDRVSIVQASEVQIEHLAGNVLGVEKLPWVGLLEVSTRKSRNPDETLLSIELDLSGISAAMQPDWWLPWENALPAIHERVKPIVELQQRRPKDAALLQKAIQKTGLPPEQLRYLPLTSSKNKEWIALFNPDLRIVGYAPVDGF